MAEPTRNRFIAYLAPLLDALRSTDPTPMRPAEARAWIQARTDVPADDLTRLIINGKQSIFENQVHWARFYLAKAMLVNSPKRGLWGLTQEGRKTQLTPDESWALYVRVRDANRPNTPGEEEEVAAPESQEDAEFGVSFWFVGALWNKVDQLPRFLSERIWENGYDTKFSGFVRRMKPGDQIVVKTTFVQREGLPFDVGGKPVSVMRIRATGTITENLNDGKTVKVAWAPASAPRDWYFYTYISPIVEADTEGEDARQLLDFTFHGAIQNHAWFLSQPYWMKHYGLSTVPPIASQVEQTIEPEQTEIDEVQNEQPYAIQDLIDEGCFLSVEELTTILNRWRAKKNLVLQGPPGTGKTWLAKRLAYALVGSNDRETDRSRLRVVQFHPSLSYEDFVRGWRPTGEGRLALADGIMMQAIDAAKSEPDRPFVLVIEEINRGNPSQIFGEMLTLLEDTKRKREEAIELAYRKSPDERVYVPDNLYVIGTMNVADRSLAIVDLALRRRFAFVDLEPKLGDSWRAWCQKQGLDMTMLNEVANRIGVLNSQITLATSLGPQFRIGHSYVTPTAIVTDGLAWFLDRVETEIGPLLDEYWYDAPETAKDARAKLLAGLM